ncbi:MAG: winged helix-turn-helix domain-containing protein [Solirubrobacteraceae bacterium]
MPDLAERIADPALAPSILLVEDEPGIVDFLKRGLQVEGFLVEAALSTTEFELLVYLMRHEGKVLSREQILSTVWGVSVYSTVSTGSIVRAIEPREEPVLASRS